MARTQEKQLVLQSCAGDQTAFGDLVRQHQTTVFNVAYRVLGNRQAAEDATQEAFVRAYRALDRFDKERPFAPWVKRICLNVCINWLEAEKIRPQTTASDLGRPDAPKSAPEQWRDTKLTPEQTVMQTETAQHLRTAILQLPPTYRAVIELRHFQEMSYAEIATALQRPLSSIKSDLFRARKILAKELRL